MSRKGMTPLLYPIVNWSNGFIEFKTQKDKEILMISDWWNNIIMGYQLLENTSNQPSKLGRNIWGHAGNIEQ